MRQFVHRLVGTVAALILVVCGWACIWDSDTLKLEQQRLPDVYAVIAGRFERYPAAYYEHRLERTQALIADGSAKVADYDDAAVSLDRLGRYDEAVGIMDLKKQRIAQFPTQAERDDAEYKRLANRGTFLIHQWLADGATDQRKSLAERGLDDLRAAVKLNPQAHFGREIVQIRLVEMLVDPTKMTGARPDHWNLGIQGESSEKVRDGLIGIVVLGSGWESPDVLRAIQTTLTSTEAHTRELLDLRIAELKAAGKPERLDWPVNESEIAPDNDAVREGYAALMQNGNEYSANLQAFVGKQLAAGHHPDTDPDFWKGYAPVAQIDLTPYSREIPTKADRQLGFLLRVLLGLGVGIALISWVAYLISKHYQETKKAA